MEVLTYQIAVFFKDKQMRPDELWYKLRERFSDVIDKMPVIIPLPESAPEEFPVVSFTSSNGIFSVNISKTRADFIINLEGKPPLEKRTAYNNCKEFAKNFSELVCVKRVGIVGRFILVEQHNVERLNKQIFNNKFNNAIELSMRVNNRRALEGFSLNDITDIQTVEGEKEKKKVNGIIVMRDINNVDLGMVISDNKIEKLIDYAFDCFEESKIEGLL